jgi:hypothetical protein
MLLRVMVRVLISFSLWGFRRFQQNPADDLSASTQIIRNGSVASPRAAALASGPDFHLISNPVPDCANPRSFCLSQIEKCGYSEKAQRFPGDNDLN